MAVGGKIPFTSSQERSGNLGRGVLNVPLQLSGSFMSLFYWRSQTAWSSRNGILVRNSPVFPPQLRYKKPFLLCRTGRSSYSIPNASLSSRSRCILARRKTSCLMHIMYHLLLINANRKRCPLISPDFTVICINIMGHKRV